MRAALPSTASSLGLAERIAENQRSPRRSIASRFGFGPIICSLALVGAWVVATALTAQKSTAAEAPVSDSDPLLQLRLPKTQAGVFLKAVSVAYEAAEAGRSDDARKAFAEVFRLLDALEAIPAHRESVMLAKATLYARTLTDRVSAQRELARVLQINPNSKQALALASRLREEEVSTRQNPSDPASALPLVPRLTGKKGDVP